MPRAAAATATAVAAALALGLLAPRVEARAAAPAADDEAADDDAAPAAGAAAVSFETLAAGAARADDVAALLGPFVDSCAGVAREIDRIRCRSAQSFLRKALPARNYVVSLDDPAAIAVSEYDGGIRGYRLALAGCIACTTPIALGGGGETRFVTAKVPQRGAPSLQKAVELDRSTVGFETPAEAQHWLQDVRPRLRAELVFRPAPAGEWTFGPSRGYAVELLGERIYDRCTGQILMSRPPSTEPGPHASAHHAEPGCPGAAARESAGDRATGAAADRAAPAGDNDDDGQLRPELSRSDIADSMARIRAQVFACYQKYKVAGTIHVAFKVAGSGTSLEVRVGGPLAGTLTGGCVLDAARSARFPRFEAESQMFVYPFFLRP
jgi:hypothetical protein